MVRNGLVSAVYDTESATFRLMEGPSGREFLRDGRFTAGGGSASVVRAAHSVFGNGRAIEIRHPDGRRDQIQLFRKLPFALFRSTLTNAEAGVKVVRNYEPFTATIDVGRPAAEVRTLGTGGLLPADQNPGSYIWLAYVDPASRAGVVAGWLTQARGSGIVFSQDPSHSDQIRIIPRVDCGRLRLTPGRTEDLETLAIGRFDDARLGLEQWADAVVRDRGIRLPPQPTGYCTWYSNPHGAASDEKHLAELADYAATNLAPYGFSVVQIDDNWQAGVSTNGPKRNFTTHAPAGPYPSGMKAIADKIRSVGLTPGIWFMPFAGTYYDPFFKDRADWFVKREDGSPYETDWGGTCLDLTNPQVLDYLRANIRRIGHEWGFGYFKMDGLWTGAATKQIYVNEGYREDGFGDAVHLNLDKTNLEAYRDGLRLIRETAGKNVFILGCCIPQNMRSYGGAFGFVDAMRIGPDNGAGWNDLLRGPTFGSRHYFLHGRVWYNDPDPVYVRTNVPLNQARAICSWVAVSGQLNMDSEWIPGLPAERLDLLRRTMPSHGLKPRPVDLFERPIPRVWLLTDERRGVRRDIVGLFNWEDHDIAIDESLERVGLDAHTTYLAYSYWDDRALEPMRGRLKANVPARSCVVLALRSASSHPQVLSTSRHVTQGIVDVVSEEWHSWGRRLQGRSRVVGGEPYELRIPLPEGERPWRVKSWSATGVETRGPLDAEARTDAGLARVTIHSPKTQEVNWKVVFDW